MKYRSTTVFADKHMYKGTITVDDEAPINGTCVTPVWIGIHDGVFDTYNGNEPLPDFMESLVEDGASGPLVAAFAADDGGVWDGGVGMGPICPGEEATLNFEFEEAAAGTKLFVSYASMILPSNDAWVGNGNHMQYPIIDESGAFMPVTIDVAGTAVLDGGTEVNDEIRANTAFFGQMAPNTGVDENGVVVDHQGFLSAGPILEAFPGADFTKDGYKVMTIKVTGEKVTGDGTTSGAFALGSAAKIIAVVSSALFAFAM